jgi:IclR family acetate operon transcriptional repressor
MTDTTRSKGSPARATSAGVQSLGRAFDVLELMAAADGEIALSRLAEASGLPGPTIHRIVRTLVARGYVLQMPSRRYVLGPRLIGLGAGARASVEAWASPPLQALAEQTGETANLAMLDRDRVVYVAQVPSTRHTMRMLTEVGRRVHAHCTGVGKVLLAQLADDEARRMLSAAGMPATTPRTITDLDLMLEELARVRDQGYAVDDGEQELGVRCVAVAVNAVTAISVSGPTSRVTRKAVPRLAGVLQEAARSLAGRQGRRG